MGWAEALHQLRSSEALTEKAMPDALEMAMAAE
jgi:hypothetical protein